MKDDPNIQNNLSILKEDGRPPATRLSTALQARGIFDRLWQADEPRSRKRAMLKGLIDGNPPYRAGMLKAQGRDYQCNVNWHIAESYFKNAVGAFYDLFQESPTYAVVKTAVGTPEERDEWSKTITEQFDWLLRGERCFDFNVQVSQNEMVLYGRGPLFFQDVFDWRPKAVLDGQLKVPERTKSDTDYWELATCEVDYRTDEIYGFIVDKEAATKAGWDVKAVKKAIIQSNPDSLKGGRYKNWEWQQQQLKNDALSYGFYCNTICTAHIFYREYPKDGEYTGKISHKIILIGKGVEEQDKFLFEKENQFEDWSECIHPMYYDHGGGGFHHSVNGMGVPMYSGMEFQNRLLCNLADKAFTPKVMFRPTTANQSEEFALQQFGEFAVLNDGYDMLQTPISGVMEEGMVFNRELTGIISSNLSQYRSNLAQEKGNPITATEAQYRASEQARLGKTQLNRYYEQLDHLDYEMFKRAVKCPKSAPGGYRAAEFRKRCYERGVPPEALQKVESVKAYRVVGQGSEFMRQQSIDFVVANLLPMLPENGRQNVIIDALASRVGQDGAKRYYPTIEQQPTQQEVILSLQIASLKDGMPAVVEPSQNPMIFASGFLSAAAQAFQSLQQGGNPQEVLAFVQLCGQAAAAHIQRMAADPSRKQAVKVLGEQLKQLAQMTDELTKAVQQQAQQQAEQQQAMQEQKAAMESEFALAKAKQDAELFLRAQKTQAGIEDKIIKTRQNMSILDAKSAQAMQIEQDRHRMEMANGANGDKS